MKKEKIYRKVKAYRLFLCALILVLLVIILPKDKEAVSLASETLNYENSSTISMYVSDSNGTEEKNGIKYTELSSEDRMPSEGYTINEENSYCYNGSKDNINTNAKLYTNEEGEHVIEKLQKGDKCILYFDKQTTGKTISEILASMTKDTSRTAANKSFNVPLNETTTGKVFTTEDNDGTSYYFAGNPTDNWVYFGGYYWRIIRINGDGTIRMIYQGTTAATTGATTNVVSNVKYNTISNDNIYVGYWYGISGQLRGLTNPSNIYTILNNWFASSNIKQDSEYYQYIDPNAGFCNDRTPSTTYNSTVSNGVNAGDGNGGTGTTTTYYVAYLRLRPNAATPTTSTTAVTPSLKCTNSDDLFTYSGANQGNKKLANPVGLITADEVAFGGLVYGLENATTANYLYTGQNYWTMSPFSFHASNPYVFYVHSTGYLTGYYVANVFGARPVINLRSDIKLSGDGTQNNPYTVS